MRLTYELGHKGSKEYDVHEDNVMYANSVIHAINKLGQLEDIEEDLGVDLNIYLKMTLGTKVFTKNKDMIGLSNHEDGIFEQRELCYLYSSKHKCFCLKIMGAKTPIYYVKDYGITWALTKEELEKGD